MRNDRTEETGGVMQQNSILILVTAYSFGDVRMLGWAAAMLLMISFMVYLYENI
jgi:hypothetical protein